MAHEDEGGAVRSSGVQTVETGGLDGLSGDGLGDSLLVGVDDGGIAAHLAQQRLGDGDGLELIAVAVHHLHHLVVLRAVHQMGGLDDQILHAVGNSALQSLLHVVDLLAVTGLDMVDDDLCGEGAADRPVGICGLDGVLDALDVRCAAVVERGAEADDQDLLVADVVLVAGVVLRGVAGVAAKVLGACLFALDHLLLSVGQSIPCCLCSLTLSVGVLVALLHIDGIDEICHILCCHFISLLAAYFAGGGGACGGAAGGSGRRCTAAGEDTGTQGQCGGSGGDALPVLVGCLTHCLSPFCLCGMYFSDRKGTKRGSAQTKKEPFHRAEGTAKRPFERSGFLVRPIPRDPEPDAPVPTAGRFPD